jgi:hypothetical protein
MLKIENVIRPILGIAGCMGISLGTRFVADNTGIGWVIMAVGVLCVMALVPPKKQDEN